MNGDRQIDRQIDRQTDRLTDRQTRKEGKNTDRVRKKDRQTDINRQEGRKNADRQTERKKGVEELNISPSIVTNMLLFGPYCFGSKCLKVPNISFHLNVSLFGYVQSYIYLKPIALLHNFIFSFFSYSFTLILVLVLVVVVYSVLDVRLLYMCPMLVSA